MHKNFRTVKDFLNHTFDLLELVVVRLALLGLAVLGAWGLLANHK